MITLQEAIAIAQNKASVLPTENVYFQQASGRVLAQDIYSDVNMPPFNKSAMDGYACRKEDLGNWLDLLEVIPAGTSPAFEITPGTCSKIMTGAEVPEGANTVFMVEQSEVNEQNQVRFTGAKTRSNICLLGEDVQQGQLVLKSGTLIKPQHIAILASVGCVQPLVYRRPKIGIVSTGSELVEPDQLPKRSQIRNSNGHQMVAQSLACACEVSYLGTVPDDEKATYKIIDQAVAENDLVLISGGVSVGDFDFVPKIIQELDFEILFNKIAVKPGKHTTFAVRENKYIIGLPGNPVSSFIQFEIFVKPFIQKMMNNQLPNVVLPLPVAADYLRRKADREEFIPVKLSADNEVLVIPYHGSAHIHAYTEAFGFLAIDEGIHEFKKGETVYVRPL